MPSFLAMSEFASKDEMQTYFGKERLNEAMEDFDFDEEEIDTEWFSKLKL